VCPRALEPLRASGVRLGNLGLREEVSALDANSRGRAGISVGGADSAVRLWRIDNQLTG
jgi:hypothetical protein